MKIALFIGLVLLAGGINVAYGMNATYGREKQETPKRIYGFISVVCEMALVYMYVTS